MSRLESHGQDDCRRFESLADLTDFAVQFRYDAPALIEGLNRPSLISEVETVLNYVEMLLESAPHRTG